MAETGTQVGRFESVDRDAHNQRHTVIRSATLDDIPRLVAMGTRFLTETVYRDRAPVNPARMAATGVMLLTSGIGALFVSESDDTLTGMIGLLLFENPITAEATVAELFWWVEPEHRGHGVRLLKRAERWARERGARQLHMIAPTPDVEQLYTRLGYTRLETTYQRTFA